MKNAGSNYLRYGVIVLFVFIIIWSYIPLWRVGGKAVYILDMLLPKRYPRAYDIFPEAFDTVVYDGIISLIAKIFFVTMYVIAIVRTYLCFRLPSRHNFECSAIIFIILEISVTAVLLTKAFFVSSQYKILTVSIGLLCPLFAAAGAFVLSRFSTDTNTTS